MVGENRQEELVFVGFLMLFKIVGWIFLTVFLQIGLGFEDFGILIRIVD